MEAMETPAVFSRLLSGLSRTELEAVVSVGIDLMNMTDGDPDLEDATDAEDDFTLSDMALGFGGRGPGCEASDQDAGAYVEWHTMRGSQKRGPNVLAGHEDAEEDDPAGQADEDGINTCRDLLRRTDGPGCILSDPDMAVDDRACDGDEGI